MFRSDIIFFCRSSVRKGIKSETILFVPVKKDRIRDGDLKRVNVITSILRFVVTILI